MVTGIICEYNPFHSGHKKQFDMIKSAYPEDRIVCLMSGNYVQRGAPAIFHRAARAKAALLNGADLVLELPVTVSLSSAEGFAAGGVSLLSGFCDRLCFGTENASADDLTEIARILLSNDFLLCLREKLEEGLSFPAARQTALESFTAKSAILSTPNNILAIEYCKAILSQNSNLQAMPILREGDYHSLAPDTSNPSATFLRREIVSNANWKKYVPVAAAEIFENASVHQLSNCERAILYRLRTMTDEEFEALPYGSEGLWRKLMYAARREKDLEGIINTTKSKRYTRTRIDRMILCAFLQITETDLSSPAPYARVLALNNNGREVLKTARQHGQFPNIGEVLDHPYQLLENRCDDLYGLFAGDIELPAGSMDRIFYHE